MSESGVMWPSDVDKYKAARLKNVEDAKRIAELEAENARLKQERKVVEDYCWSKAGGKISVAGTIYRYLSEGIKIPQQGENRDE